MCSLPVRLGLVLLGLTSFLPAHAAPSPWTLIWSDEFSGRAGTQPSGRHWNYDLGNEEQSGWGNKELESYTRSPDNVRLDGQGHLEIRALKNSAAGKGADLYCWNGDVCPYTSARLTT